MHAHTDDLPLGYFRVTRRAINTLPPHVLGASIHWDGADPTGYYLVLTQPSRNFPVEFFDNSWFTLNTESDGTYTATQHDRIPRYEANTGYWNITDREHPEHLSPIETEQPQYTIGSEPSTAATQRSFPSTPHTGSAFATPRTGTPIAGPSFTTPRPRADTLDSNDQPEDQSDHTDEEDLPEEDPETQDAEETLDTEVLVAAVQHGLDIEDTGSTDPNNPDFPANLAHIQQVVAQAFPPVLPPIAHTPPLFAPVLVQQPIFVQPLGPVPALAPAPVAMAQNPPAPNNLRGTPPAMYDGDRKKSKEFKRDFNLYAVMNDQHELITSPYKKVVLALSFMRGPNINDWKADQLKLLIEKTTRAANPIPNTDPVLWTEFETAFNTAFTNTTEKQTAHSDLLKLKMD